MLLLSLALAAPAGALTLPFTEEFATDNADWKDGGGFDLTWNATGGPDGGSYASGNFSFQPFPPDEPITLARAQDEFGSSGGAFEGDWIANNVLTLSVFFRHDLPFPVSPFARLTQTGNFPGAIAIFPGAVLPNTWTPLTFDVSAGSPFVVYPEGGSYASIFGAIAHVQFGVETPPALAGSPVVYEFGIDKVSIVPEPGTAAMIGLALVGIAVSGRREH